MRNWIFSRSTIAVALVVATSALLMTATWLLTSGSPPSTPRADTTSDPVVVSSDVASGSATPTTVSPTPTADRSTHSSRVPLRSPSATLTAAAASAADSASPDEGSALPSSDALANSALPASTSASRVTPSVSPTCHPYGRVDGIKIPTSSGSVATFEIGNAAPENQPICPGETIPVFWATYQMDSTGTFHLYLSGTSALTLNHPTWSSAFQLPSPASCSASFVGKSPGRIPATFPLSEDPFAGYWVFSESPKTDAYYYQQFANTDCPR